MERSRISGAPLRKSCALHRVREKNDRLDPRHARNGICDTLRAAGGGKNAATGRPKQRPGTVSRPGALREFQFHESTDLHDRVKRTRLRAQGNRSGLTAGH